MATTSWPIPQPGDIAGRAAAVFEQAFPPDPATGDPGIDARSDNTVATTICRITELAMMDLYYYQGNEAVELMPDTAEYNLYRFGNIYEVPRDQPAAAEGNLIVTTASGTTVVVPAETAFTLPGSPVVWTTTMPIPIAFGDTSASLPVVASPAGAAGNLPAGTVLTPSSPISGLAAQVGVVDSNGIVNGADQESLDSWRSRILAQIRYQPSGGNYGDYVKWAEAALPGVTAVCPPGACGGGIVSVVCVMAGAVVPDSGQLATIQAYINTQRPVTAQPTVYACTLNPISVTLHLNPDTPAIRAAASAALALSFEQDAVIGGTTYASRLNNAVSSSDGEYSHEMTAPTADVVAPTLFALNTLGPVSFV